MKKLWLLRAIGLAGFLGLAHVVHAGDLPDDFSHKFELVSTSFALSQATIMVVDHIDPQYDFAGPIFIAGNLIFEPIKSLRRATCSFGKPLTARKEIIRENL